MNLYDINKEIDEIYNDKRKKKKILYLLYLITLVLLVITPPLAVFGMLVHESLLTIACAGLIACDLVIVVLQKVDIKEYDKLIEELKQEKNKQKSSSNVKQDSLVKNKKDENVVQQSNEKNKYDTVPLPRIIQEEKTMNKIENNIVQPKPNSSDVSFEDAIVEMTLASEGMIITKEQAIKELEELKLEFLSDIEEELGFSKVLK